MIKHGIVLLSISDADIIEAAIFCKFMPKKYRRKWMVFIMNYPKAPEILIKMMANEEKRKMLIVCYLIFIKLIMYDFGHINRNGTSNTYQFTCFIQNAKQMKRKIRQFAIRDKQWSDASHCQRNRMPLITRLSQEADPFIQLRWWKQ